jgi:8-oxo-dGTP diphosphatase
MLMALSLQDALTTVAVFLAAGYVVWRVVRAVRQKAGPSCNCCGTCPAASPHDNREVLVALDPSAKMTIPDDPGRRGAVGVAVRDGRMLVIRRSRSVVAPLVHCFPGGGIEAGESEEQALVREFREEVGLSVRPLRRLWHCVTAWKVDLAWWLVEIEPGAEPVANPSEVESIHWLTPDEMAALPDLLESNREFLDYLRQSPQSL